MPVFDEDYETAKVRYWKERTARFEKYWASSPNPSYSEFHELEKPHSKQFSQEHTPKRVKGEQVSGKVRKLKALRDRELKRGAKGGLYYEIAGGRRVYVKE